MLPRNLSLEDKLLAALQADVDFGDNEQTGAVLNAVAALYKATGDAKFADAAKTIADKAISSVSLEDAESLANFEYGKGMYSAFDATGDEEYRKIAKKIAEQLATQPRYEEGIFKGSQDNGEKRPCRTYMYMPFYMTYETRDGGKERYNDIIAQARTYRTNYFDRFAGSLGTEKCAYNVISHFAAAMIDTMEAMDQMLYEIYHEMMDYYRDAVKAVAEAGVAQCEGKKADYVFGYALLKGCRMKAVHTEKYEKLVIELMDKLEQEYGDCENADAESCGCSAGAYTLAFKAMYYSEAIRNREYQDYGRGKGGVLWS